MSGDSPIGKSSPSIRRLVPSDVPVFLHLIQALADYERLPRPDDEARARLARDALSENPPFSVLLAERDGNTVGYAVFLMTYSTFLALPTLYIEYIEDIFVLPEQRRSGAGRAMMRALATEAVRRGCGRMDWQVLDWNEPAISFYRSLGASEVASWRTFRLTGDDIYRLSREDGAFEGM
jgi:GNAT superfamily N-acetyltransferase